MARQQYRKLHLQFEPIECPIQNGFQICWSETLLYIKYPFNVQDLHFVKTQQAFEEYVVFLKK